MTALSGMAAIRARHFGPASAPAAAPPPFPPRPAVVEEDSREEWLGAVDAAAITRRACTDGGYQLLAGSVRIASVRRVGDGWVVRNLGAACDSPRFPDRPAADRLAMRIARLVVAR